MHCLADEERWHRKRSRDDLFFGCRLPGCKTGGLFTTTRRKGGQEAAAGWRLDIWKCVRRWCQTCLWIRAEYSIVLNSTVRLCRIVMLRETLVAVSIHQGCFLSMSEFEGFHRASCFSTSVYDISRCMSKPLMHSR